MQTIDPTPELNELAVLIDQAEDLMGELWTALTEEPDSAILKRYRALEVGLSDARANLAALQEELGENS